MPIPKILSILKPTIKKDDVVLVDRKDERFNDLKDPNSQELPDEKTTGSTYPYVSIRSVVVEVDELKYFELSCDGFLPEINITVADKRSRLSNVDFPLDGDLISVYIRPNDDDIQKSIRLDFEIVSTNRSGTTTLYYDFYGVLRVPTLYDELCTFKEGTSFDALMSVCSDLGLGFASNDDCTNDLQKWILPKENREKFIKDITKYSYKDDNSFFISFVDLFYHLNFINIQNCFSLEDSLESAVISTKQTTDNTKSFEKTSTEGAFFLTNSKENSGSNTMIVNFSPFNNSGNTVKANGYRRTVQMYDDVNLEYVDNFIEPLVTKGSNDKVLLRGRKDENFFKTLHKFKYMGKQNENMHPNYHFARILNHQNNEEVLKAGLMVTIDSLNIDIFRYRRVPVLIYDRLTTETKTSNLQRDEQNGDEKTTQANVYDEQQEVRNEFLSGFYVVDSFTIKFMDNAYKTDIKLLRREWNQRATTVGAFAEPS